VHFASISGTGRFKALDDFYNASVRTLYGYNKGKQPKNHLFLAKTKMLLTSKELTRNPIRIGKVEGCGGLEAALLCENGACNGTSGVGLAWQNGEAFSHAQRRSLPRSAPDRFFFRTSMSALFCMVDHNQPDFSRAIDCDLWL
jgi:hypothetical protein